jgi:hypothetical protein
MSAVATAGHYFLLVGSMEKFFLLIYAFHLIPRPANGSYLNATLTSMGGDLSVTVFLPKSINASENAFYESSRFEHGSMIGAIRKVIRDSAGNPTSVHTMYGPDLWRNPHDSHWPESGVGLASEFGAGEDGPLCNLRCGWPGANSVTNGLLGYKEARPGEPFIKIGVGVLVKGMCVACDTYENYLFNSPYAFVEQPIWTLQRPQNNTIILENGALLHSKSLFGYHLRKEISLNENVLSVKSTLTNWGEAAFTTPWYSHHFFSCDGQPIGPGYEVDLFLKPTPTGTNMESLYDEPGLLWWSTPIRNYAKLSSLNGTAIAVEIKHEVEDGKRIKVEFHKDDTTDGSFILKGCGLSITEQIPEVADPSSGVIMYSFGLYMERTTLSPEPFLLLHLEPGKSISWTQVLTIENNLPPPTPSSATSDLLPATIFRNSLVGVLRPFESKSQLLLTLILLGTCFGSIILLLRTIHSRRRKYSVLTDVQVSEYAGTNSSCSS